MRRELLIAAKAAAAWPRLRSGWNWYSNDKAEYQCGYPYPVLVAVARRYGDPAVAVAAYRAYLSGKPAAAWRAVWQVQVALMSLLSAAGEPSLNSRLGEDPDGLAALLRDLAEL